MAKIMVVDDSKVMRKKIAALLEEAGHGRDAFMAYARYNPDLVTMDITMPVMDGIQAVKKIVPNYPDAKIIMISSLGQQDMVMEAIRNGAKHFIVKPFTAEKAKEIINKVLSQDDDD